MGGTTVGLLDTVVASEHVARRVLEGIRRATDIYMASPSLDAHLSVMEGPPSVSAFALRPLYKVLSATNLGPGQLLFAACCP